MVGQIPEHLEAYKDFCCKLERFKISMGTSGVGRDELRDIGF